MTQAHAFELAREAGFSAGHVLLEFSAPWCGPCHVARPRVLELVKRSPLPRYHVDVEDDAHGLTSSLGVKKLPTYLLLQDGRELARVEGADLESLEALLRQAEAGPLLLPPPRDL